MKRFTRRFRRRPTYRRYKRARLPKSFARNEIYMVPAGIARPTIAPGDCWVKRRVSWNVTVAAAGGAINQNILWQAITSNIQTNNAVMPYTATSTLSIRVRSFRVWAKTAGLDFLLQVNEQLLQQDETNANPKEFIASARSSVSYASMGIKIPTPQQVVQQTVGAGSSGQLLYITPNPQTATSYKLLFSILVKV